AVVLGLLRRRREPFVPGRRRARSVPGRDPHARARIRRGPPARAAPTRPVRARLGLRPPAPDGAARRPHRADPAQHVLPPESADAATLLPARTGDPTGGPGLAHGQAGG